MKASLFLLITFFSFNLIAQVSQHEYAKEWSDGNYTWFGLNSEEKAVKVIFEKNSFGHVARIKVNDEWFEAAETDTEFIRYYKSTDKYSENNLFFTKKGLFAFKQTKSEEWQRVLATIGPKDLSWKNLSQTIASEQSKGKEYQEKIWKDKPALITSIKGHKVKNIEVKLIPIIEGQLMAETIFSVGTITTLEDGSILKSKNLGGVHEIKNDFEVTINGANPYSATEYKILECARDRPHWVLPRRA